MEKIKSQLQLTPNFDHQTVVEYILANLPNASSQILGDAEAIFFELKLNDLDKEAAFAGLVLSGGIDAERFAAAYDLLEKTLVYGASKEVEGLLGQEQPNESATQKLGELAVAQPEVDEELQPSTTPAPTPSNNSTDSRPVLVTLQRSSGIDESSSDWRDRALCKNEDPEKFFPEKVKYSGPAIEICKRCTARVECATFAIDNREQFGVWGGTTERDREDTFRKLKRQEAMRNRNSNN